MQPTTKVIIGVLASVAAIGIVVIYRNNAAAAATAASVMPVTVATTTPATTSAPAANIYSYTPPPVSAISGGAISSPSGGGASTTPPPTPGAPLIPQIPQGLTAASQIQALPVSSYSNFSWADGNNFPLAAKMIIDATSSNLANQASLELQWYDEIQTQSPIIGNVFYTAAANMYAQGVNKKGSLFAPLRIAFQAAQNPTAVAAANAKGISAVTLAQNLINAYNQAYS